MRNARPLFFYRLSAWGLVFFFLVGLFYSFKNLDYEWDFSSLLPYIWFSSSDGSGPGLLTKGLWTTMVISFQSIVLGTLLGTCVGLIMCGPDKSVRFFAYSYVDVLRNTPLLVQLQIAYFIVGTMLDLSGPVAGVLTLGVFCSAYVADIVRGTLMNFETGQIDAARAMGLTPFQIALDVVIPQALRRMLPPLVGQFVSVIKDSCLVSVIAVSELTKEAQNAITVHFRSFETWLFVAFLYFILNSSVSGLGRLLEKKLAAGIR